MNYNWHTWELEFDDTPLMIGDAYLGTFAGTANMARDVCESITLQDFEDGRYHEIKPGHVLFEPLWSGIRYSYPNATRIERWREEVAA